MSEVDNSEAHAFALKMHARSWRDAQALADERRDDVIELVRFANQAGMSEYALADAAGVTRMTIRNWLGKPTR